MRRASGSVCLPPLSLGGPEFTPPTPEGAQGVSSCEVHWAYTMPWVGPIVSKVTSTS